MTRKTTNPMSTRQNSSSGHSSHHPTRRERERGRKSFTILSPNGEPVVVHLDPEEAPPPYTGSPPDADHESHIVVQPTNPQSNGHLDQDSIGEPVYPPHDETTPLLNDSQSQSHHQPQRQSSAIARYFAILFSRPAWSSLSYLLLLNFPFALAIWIFVFVGTVLGTTLLLTLPLGVCVWWVVLVGARGMARGELVIQYTFNPPCNSTPLPPPRPIFNRDARSLRMRHASLLLESTSEDEPDITVSPTSSPFIAESYLLFTDPYSFRCLLYFLIPKACIALSFFVLFVILTSVVGIGTLGLGMPMVLRWARQAGGWHRRVAVEMLR